jgi:hypothetical protein
MKSFKNGGGAEAAAEAKMKAEEGHDGAKVEDAKRKKEKKDKKDKKDKRARDDDGCDDLGDLGAFADKVQHGAAFTAAAAAFTADACR